MTRTALHRLTRQDAGYLRRETAAQPMHFVLHVRVAPRADGTSVTLDEVRTSVAARLAALPELRRRVRQAPFDIGLPVWVDDPAFDITRHVTAWTVDPSDANGVAVALAAETALPIDRAHPLWRLRVGPALADGFTPLALSFHHALMDGGLLAAVLPVLFGETVPPASPAPPLKVSAARLLASGLLAAVRARFAATRRRWTRSSLVSGSVEPAGPAAPPAGAAGPGLTGVVGATRAVAEVRLRLSDVRAVRTASGATINDLYLEAITAGLRGLLADRGELAEASRLLAMVPRNVRAAEDARAAGNRTWSLLIPLPVGEEDRRSRLTEIQAATQAAKEANRSFGAGGFAFDIAVSNVALGAGHSVAGACIHSYTTTAPLQGRNRVLAVALSYEDTFTVTFTADAEAFPDLASLAAHTQAGFAGQFGTIARGLAS